jgi:SAM-dependent methyltransferase
MGGYYARKLSGERLRRCYEIASPRVRRYLEAEIEFVLGRLEPRSHVLELGCGYGRMLRVLAGKAGRAVGIDTACESLLLARAVSSSPPTRRASGGPASPGFAPRPQPDSWAPSTRRPPATA